jgi:hypothetical protein
MLHTDFSTLDFSRYKRFFVIGCSFTQWHWPMWADVIASQNPHLEFKNFGQGGSGNIYIMCVLSQLIQKYNLGEGDCVGIMWSSFHRNDYYRCADDLRDQLKRYTVDFCGTEGIGVMNNWRSAGDQIAGHFTTNKTTSDDRGHLMRDCGFIHVTTELLKNAKFDSFQMLSIGLREQGHYDESLEATYKDDVFDMYESYIEQHTIGGPMYSVEFNLKWDETVWWIPAWLGPEDKNAEQSVDHHPSTSRWCNYLEKIGYTVSEQTRSWAERCDNRVKNTAYARELVDDPMWKWNSVISKTGYMPL